MSFSKKSIWLIAVLFITVISCSKDETEEEVPGVDPNARFLSANIDGEEYISEGIFLEGTIASNGFGYSFGIAGTNVNISGIKAVTLALAGLDFSQIGPGTTYSYIDTISSNVFGGSYDSTIDDGIDADNMQSGQATITAIDTVAKVFSGTFSFVAIDDETNISYSVTNGIFQNVEYDD